MGDWLTTVKYGMNVTHVLLRNDQLGKITKEQRAGHWDVWETGLHNPSFAEFARISGSLGIEVRDAAQLDAALEQALAAEGPSLVEIHTDAELI
jgi:thiamine pyrophosphate-dependent acetolactate synthase large subunit-like protein